MTRILAFLAALPLFAQEGPVFRAETSLATVSFHVVRDKRYVDDLKPQDLILLEDGNPRNITFFEGGRVKQRTTSVEIALLFDISGSVVDEGLLDMTVWKDSFLGSLPGASLAVYGFDSRLLRFCSPTRDIQVLGPAFNSVLKTSKSGMKITPAKVPISLPANRKSNKGGTWIYEAVIGAVNDMADWPGRSTRLIVIFSDGFPTTTSVPEDAAKVSREAGVTIYPVALGHGRIAERMRQLAPRLVTTTGRPNDNAELQMSNLRMQEQEIMDFASMGELTGGRSFDPPMMNSDMLKRIMSSMVGSVLSEYVVGFTPEVAGTPVKHKLAVKLASKELGKLTGGTRTVVH